MKRVLIIPLLFITFALSAAPIGERKAREIATAFFSATSTRATSPTLSLEWAGKELPSGSIARLSATVQDDEMLYIYNRSDAAGFVVVAGDDNVEKSIIAFSHDNHLQIDNLSGGTRYLLAGWCRQVAAARKATTSTTRASDSANVGVTQRIYNTALWSQGTPFNNEAPVIDGNRAVTGCVATAMSIICHYHKWPERGVGTTPAYTYRDGNGVTREVPANTLGHLYDYDNMLSDYAAGYTSKQAAAVAALMKDMGTSVKMSYHYNASGATDTNVPIALMTYFGYAKSTLLMYGASYTYRDWIKALKENISQYGPTYFSGIDENNGGHAFILDGYTSANYFHINYGWGGYGNGYFLLPDIEYAYDQNALFYLEPDKAGTSSYRDHLLLLSSSTGGLWSDTTEFSVGESFKLTSAAVWNVGSVSFNGDVQVALCDVNGAIKETLWKRSVSLQVMYYCSIGTLNLSITTPIVAGDRIRMLYKGQYTESWQWMKQSDGVANEIIVSVTPEDIAKSLSFRYDTKTNGLSFVSTYNLDYEVHNSSSMKVHSGKVVANERTTINVSGYEPGEYVIYFRKDNSEYKLDVTL